MSRGGAGHAQEECLEVSGVWRGRNPARPQPRVPTASCAGTSVLPGLAGDQQQEQDEHKLAPCSPLAGRAVVPTCASSPTPWRWQWPRRFHMAPSRVSRLRGQPPGRRQGAAPWPRPGGSPRHTIAEKGIGVTLGCEKIMERWGAGEARRTQHNDPSGRQKPLCFCSLLVFCQAGAGQGCCGAEPGVGDASTAPVASAGPSGGGHWASPGDAVRWGRRHPTTGVSPRAAPSCPGHGCRGLGPQGLGKCQQPSGEGLIS